MVDRERPCDRGLTPECFEKYPAWARQAFAHRLMHTLCPARITGRLPGKLGEPLIGPGAIIPPGVIIPPWVIVPPGYVWPIDWTPKDPLPPGIIPAPLPPVPDEPPDGGVVPPIYVPPWEPGPPHRPSPSPGEAWVSHFNTSNWECDQADCEWESGAWQTEEEPKTPTLQLISVEDPEWWYEYYPTKMRVYYSTAAAVKVELWDCKWNLITPDPAIANPASGQIQDLSFEEAEDICYFRLEGQDFEQIRITDIQFLGG